MKTDLVAAVAAVGLHRSTQAAPPSSKARGFTLLLVGLIPRRPPLKRSLDGANLTGAAVAMCDVCPQQNFGSATERPMVRGAERVEHADEHGLHVEWRLRGGRR